MTINTDKITTITGLLSTVAASLAGYGIYPQYTVPAAGILASIFAVFTKGVTTSTSRLGQTEVR